MPITVSSPALRRGITALLLALLLGGCAAAPRHSAEAVPLPEHFSHSGEAPLAQAWWREFGDTTLDALIEEALQHNFNLQAIWHRLSQAEASARKAGAGRLPSINASLGVTRGSIYLTSGQRLDSDTQSAGLSASYEVDLWGRVSAGAEAAGLSYLASREALDTAALSLAAEVSLAWYALVAQQRHLAILEEQITTNRQMLEVVERRFATGQVKAADVLRQQQLLESVHGERISAETTLAVLRHQLAILLGRLPAAAPAGADTLPALPPLPATGLPGELVQRRPDLRQAFYQLRAAEQSVAVAAADRFPKLTLSASVSSRSADWSSLLDNWARSISADLLAPLFDHGSRSAEVERTRAAAAEAFSAYRQRILDSLGEVENALVREAQQQRTLESLEQRVALGRQTLERSRDYYIRGTTGYLDVLDAQRSLQALEREQNLARRQLIDYRIALYRALGGSPLAPGAQPATKTAQP